MQEVVSEANLIARAKNPNPAIRRTVSVGHRILLVVYHLGLYSDLQAFFVSAFSAHSAVNLAYSLNTCGNC